MVYLDYSATTQIDKRVLETFVKASSYYANANSLHTLGVKARKLIDMSSKQIADILNVSKDEIIYTSGASEANNMVIKGISCYSRGKTIITTPLEHSSIISPLKQMEKNGYKVLYAPLNNGIVDINKLEEMINEDTILISICAVNSETGIKQNINEIGKMIKKHPKVIFHSDMTQAIGKIKVNLDNVDLVSFSAHKFFGPKGIGVLIKKNNIVLEPLINGGKSTTKYRSGTPATELIASLSKALRLAYEEMNEDKVNSLNKVLKEKLMTYKGVHINSTENSIGHILNFSCDFIKPETLVHSLEKYDIYISTKSACSVSDISKSVYALTGSEEKAKSSVRVSISTKTTMDEINYFIDCFDKIYRRSL